MGDLSQVGDHHMVDTYDIGHSKPNLDRRHAMHESDLFDEKINLFDFALGISSILDYLPFSFHVDLCKL